MTGAFLKLTIHVARNLLIYALKRTIFIEIVTILFNNRRTARKQLFYYKLFIWEG
jgi:hypothetical protein